MLTQKKKRVGATYENERMPLLDFQQIQILRLTADCVGDFHVNFQNNSKGELLLLKLTQEITI